MGTTILLGMYSLAITILFITKTKRSNETIDELNDEVVRLDKLCETTEYAMNKNREVYGSERKALIAEHKADKLLLERYKKRLDGIDEVRMNYYSEMDNLDNLGREMTPEEFLKLRDKVNRTDSNLHDFTGIYILENKTVDKFYVGQSISLFRRAGAHFTGSGNKDIYEDYMNGEEWTIRLIALSDSGFKSINALEKHFIEYHHSTYNGYNKTIGNIN